MRFKPAVPDALLLAPVVSLHAGEGYPAFSWEHVPLGEPRGVAQREGWTYTREFEHASVFADLDRKTAKIDWK